MIIIQSNFWSSAFEAVQRVHTDVRPVCLYTWWLGSPLPGKTEFDSNMGVDEVLTHIAIFQLTLTRIKNPDQLLETTVGVRLVGMA